MMQFAGIDVSAKTLHVRVQTPSGRRKILEVDNTPDGHRQLAQRLRQAQGQTRIALEASGLYSLDLALALHRQPGFELMVVNPRAARDFARAWLHRSKTDAVDAEVILEFVQRMPFRPWRSPAPERLQLRTLGRRLVDLIQICTEEKNRLEALDSCQDLCPVVRQDLLEHIEQVEQRIEQLEAQALALIRRHEALRADFELLDSVPGIAERSAIKLLAELSVLPADMTARQWVAHAGLDPRHFESGTSVHKPARISRQGSRPLRAALYMSALVAIRRNPHVRGFYEELLDRGKAKMQAIVAVMRKLLHSIHGILRHRTHFDGTKFRALQPAP